MNVQSIRLRLHNFNNDMHELWQKFRNGVADEASPGNQKRAMTEEEMLDESLKESFPASDPPGHFSKSVEDRELH
jgi:hypothetical protein